MPAISKTERILNLISLLLKSRQPVSWQRIRDEVEGYKEEAEREESVERRFDRDKATIRQLGVSIQYTPDDGVGNEGYYIEPGSYFLPQVEFAPEEVTILAMAGRLVTASGALGSALQSALSKLEFDSPIPGDIRSTVEERYLFYQSSAGEGSEEAAKLEALTVAALGNKTVTFSYRSPTTDSSAQRTVDPYGLAFWSGHWYLAGWCHDRKAVRTFRLDRMGAEIKQPRPGDQADFEPPADFDVEEYVGRPPWQLARLPAGVGRGGLGGAQEVRVTIRLDSAIAWMVREQSQKTDTWKTRRDGSAILERSVSDPDALVRWVTGFGARAEIIGPPAMRRRFIETVRGVRSLYVRKGAAHE